MKDLKNNSLGKVAIAPVVITDDTVQTGEVIDRAGYESVTFFIASGTLADAAATFTPTVQEGDEADGSDMADCDDKFLLGTEAAAAFSQADDKSVKSIGYVGGKRYTRLKLTPSGNAANAPFAATAVLGHPRHAAQ